MKEFKINGEEVAGLYHQGSHLGPLACSLENTHDSLNPKQMRLLARWLIDAANFAEIENRKLSMKRKRLESEE